ncbi:MAG TPA: adenosylcobinamide-phosphate synthase CbiB [Bacillota bacterium]
MVNHLLAICLAYVTDLIIGDPKSWPHPVRWMGTLISFLKARCNRGKYRKQKGFMMLLFVIIIVALIACLLTIVSYAVHPLVGITVEALLIFTTISQKSLKEAALEVSRPLKENNLPKARHKLSQIVGRDTETLSEQEVIRGTVETVAENTSDGITAPLFWSVIGGAPLALVYRAVNTCDSMVGYKNEPYTEFGWASARLDDVLNWPVARLTAFVTMVVMKPRETTFKRALTILVRDAKKHNSPNSGWGEASVAALLGIQLGGINYYQGKKSVAPYMGKPYRRMQTDDIDRTIVLMQRTALLFVIMLMIGGMLFELAIARF